MTQLRAINAFASLVLAGAAAWLAGCSDTTEQAAASPEPQQRIVSLGGSITEMIYLLGEGDALVGVDTTSYYPDATGDLPKVGYLRQLSAEGVLSLSPTMIIGTEDAGPPHVVEQLQNAGVELVLLPVDKSPEGLDRNIDAVASHFGKKEAGDQLKADLDAHWERLEKTKAAREAKPKIAFIYARGGGVLNVSGTETSAAAVIGLLGGENAVTGYRGYRPLTAEAMVNAAPDVIMISEEGLESLGGADSLWELPGVALTPAGQNKRVLTATELPLLGFGPRTPKTLADLSEALDAATPASQSLSSR